MLLLQMYRNKKPARFLLRAGPVIHFENLDRCPDEMVIGPQTVGYRRFMFRTFRHLRLCQALNYSSFAGTNDQVILSCSVDAVFYMSVYTLPHDLTRRTCW